jgi:uncharacterized protein YdcH (DUF465 family)
MKNIEVIYGRLLNEHRRILNEISDINANSYELSDEEKRKVQELQKKQIQLMNQMKMLFNGNFGK